MSRVGRMPITVPAGVEVKVEAGNTVTVKGPKGTLTQTFSPIITIAQEGNEILCTRPSDDKATRAMHGTVRSVLNGMVVGVSPKQEDITVNVCKKKQMTNMRAAGSDDALRLVPPRRLSLEQCLEFLADDELLEVTPENLRIRKTILNHEKRMKASHGGKKK